MKDELQSVPDDELSEPNPSTSLVGGLGKMWRDIRHHQYLIANFVRRDLRVKYRNSTLGYFWSLLDPLLLSAMYFILFTIVAGKAQKLYPLWVILGVLSWRFFGAVLQTSIATLVGNEDTIKSIYFPRVLFATASSCSNLVMTSLSLLVAVPFMLYFRIAPTLYMLMVPLGLILLWMLGLGSGLGLACLNVVNRDVGHLCRFLVRAGLYISPVLWTVEMGQAKGTAVNYLLLNPVAVPMTMIRNGITGQRLSMSQNQIAYSVAFCLISFVVGTMIFQRYEARVIKKL
jgi:homopolymeric O-antigen transport system permease protein